LLKQSTLNGVFNIPSKILGFDWCISAGYGVGRYTKVEPLSDKTVTVLLKSIKNVIQKMSDKLK